MQCVYLIMMPGPPVVEKRVVGGTVGPCAPPSRPPSGGGGARWGRPGGILSTAAAGGGQEADGMRQARQGVRAGTVARAGSRRSARARPRQAASVGRRTDVRRA
ncbi:hypothetical protein GCM10009787_29240 [Streptomyces bangladeshensis]|uniref:Uncharacterized protein n=1 Tax=Streptomyces bangladeshensis TaxID=295352 RepID=A0ABN3BHE6_9ACTN